MCEICEDRKKLIIEYQVLLEKWKSLYFAELNKKGRYL